MKSDPPKFYKWLMICIFVPVGIAVLLLTALLTINTCTDYVVTKLDQFFIFLKIEEV